MSIFVFALEMRIRSAYWRFREAGANFELETLVKICRVLEVALKSFKGIDLVGSGQAISRILFHLHSKLPSLAPNLKPLPQKR